MQARVITSIALGLVSLLVAPFAAAHGGAHMDHGLIDGFMHPASAIDHLLVAIAAGYWVAQRGSHGLHAALFFIGLLAVGLAIGAVSHAWPQFEMAMPVAFMLTAAIIAIAIAMPHVLLQAMFGGYAVYHGMVHALAVPGSTGVVGFGVGLLLSTVVLMKIGFILNHIVSTHGPRRV